MLEAHSSTFRAYPFWDSEFQYLNAARYLSFAELSINEVNVRNGYFRAFLTKGLYGLTCNVVTHYVRPVKVFKKFSVTTKVLGWDEKFFYRRVQIHQKDSLMFEALYKILIFHKGKRRLPKEVLAVMGSDFEKSPELPDEVSFLNFRASFK